MLSPICKENQQELANYLLSRTQEISSDILVKVSNILDDVRKNGDAACCKYIKQFDGIDIDEFKVSQAEIETAIQACDPAFMDAMEKAKKNITYFHQAQVQQSYLLQKEKGIYLGQRVLPLASVGIYVPGGRAQYPSSVLMNAIPAHVAGVKRIVMVTPPNKEGKIHPNIAFAAKLAGVTDIYKIGGAQAVAALAYGTESIPAVDKIVGPGNIFVAAAKKLVYGKVDIDMIAGPSEILIIADKSANPKFLAADLMSQAEHDRLASAILLTDCEELAKETETELEKHMTALSRKDIIRSSVDNFGAVIVCSDMSQAIEFANELAPEHLEVCCENPMEYVGKLDNAGSVFLGNYSPEPLGDYFAGPNHVLPTSGTARFFSPLSVDSFVKKSSFIYYTEDALRKDAEDVVRFAETEGLTAHANSIKVRFDMK